MRLTRDLASDCCSHIFSRRAVSAASWWKLSIVSLVVCFQLGGCTTTKTEDNDTTSTFVTVVSFRGSSADDAGFTDGDDIFSDVCVDPDNTGACTAINDNGIVELLAEAKDPSVATSPIQDIIFTRYRVTYVRADGRNVPGVDVPFPFDGVANFRVPLNSQTTRTFMIVRQAAKLESPLAELRNAGGAQVINTITRVDFLERT